MYTSKARNGSNTLIAKKLISSFTLMHLADTSIQRYLLEEDRLDVNTIKGLHLSYDKITFL